jgi:hypothetical protein
MCPFCLATAAVVAASATGSGGLAALVGALLRKSARKLFTQDTDTKEVEHGHDNNGPQAVERGVAQRVD